MKLRTRIALMAAPVVIAGSLFAAPAGSAPFEGPDDITACPAHVDCGPDDPDPTDGPDGFKTPDANPDPDPDPEPEPEPEPQPDPEPETPEVPEAQPEAPRPGKPNFTG